MDKLRIRFEKTGRAVYMSHLDLMRVMQRAFQRAGVPLKYSEGFNPHAQISIALPLSVGIESVCELMDFRLCAEWELSDLKNRLNAALPEGVRVLEAYEAERKITQLKWLRIMGRLEYDSRSADEMAEGLTGLFSRENIPAVKKTKRGEGEINLAPHIPEIAVLPGDGAVFLEAVISAQQPAINPDLLISALGLNCPQYAPDFAAFRRIELYDEKMLVFR
ncbi:MAG TPA: radical SAM protein [Clostridiales bacterium]|nr:radical SAM protein [Clostridiales bacterium]